MALATEDTPSDTVTLLIDGFIDAGTDTVHVLVLLPTDVPPLVYVWHLIDSVPLVAFGIWLISDVGIVQVIGDFFFVHIVPLALPNVYVSVYTFVDGVLLFFIVIESPNSSPEDGDMEGVDAVAPDPMLIFDTDVALSCADVPPLSVLSTRTCIPVRVVVVAAALTVNDVVAECEVVPLHVLLELLRVTVCHEPATLIPATRVFPVPR